VALSDFRGKVVVLAFLDPECTDVCPLTALHLGLAHAALGGDAGRVAFLTVNVNPKRGAVSDVAEATRKWGLDRVPTWHYLTGAHAELQPVWSAYGVLAEGPPKVLKPQELEHTPGVFVIDQSGQKRWYISVPYGGGPQGTAWDGPPLSDLLVKHVRALLKGAS
jgi:cytochrome oxidase Cu insertion factor (SCO1/SenC/PrrC family)